MKLLDIPTVTLEHWRESVTQAGMRTAPVMLRNALAEVMSEIWTPEFFAATYPDINVLVALKLPEKEVPYASCAASHYRRMEMREFLALLASGASCYLSQFPLQRFPGLLRQLRPSALGLGNVNAVNVWIGGATRSGLHFDSDDNMFAQVYGQKRIFLIDPRFTRYLYQFSDVPSKSMVDPEHLDWERFPRFANCEVIECRLRPGDLVFMPKGWWHFVASDDVSVSVNFWHGESMTPAALTKLYLAGGPRVAVRCVRDFVTYGVLGRKYERRLFSPASVGVQVYDQMRKRWLRKESALSKMVVN